MCVCVRNPRNVAKSNLDGRGWAWAEQIGQSAGEVDLSPHQGHGQHQAIAHPGFPSQGQLMLKGSLLFRRLKFQITTRDFSWYQLFLELYHATSLFCRLCKLEVWYHVDDIMLFLAYIFIFSYFSFSFLFFFSNLHIFQDVHHATSLTWRLSLEMRSSTLSMYPSSYSSSVLF